MLMDSFKHRTLITSLISESNKSQFSLHSVEVLVGFLTTFESNSLFEAKTIQKLCSPQVIFNTQAWEVQNLIAMLGYKKQGKKHSNLNLITIGNNFACNNLWCFDEKKCTSSYSYQSSMCAPSISVVPVMQTCASSINVPIMHKKPNRRHMLMQILPTWICTGDCFFAQNRLYFCNDNHTKLRNNGSLDPATALYYFVRYQSVDKNI